MWWRGAVTCGPNMWSAVSWRWRPDLSNVLKLGLVPNMEWLLILFWIPVYNRENNCGWFALENGTAYRPTGYMEDCRKGYGRFNFCVGDCSENTVRFTNNKTLLHYSNLIHVFNTRRGFRRRASNKRRAPNTGRGSGPFVLIDAGGFYSRKYGKCLDFKKQHF